MAVIEHLLLLTESESALLGTPESIHVGEYHTWRNEGPRTFAIELDARPLAVLAEDAVRGIRVYEFMSIRRPGDVLNYLWVNCAPAHEEVQKHVSQYKHQLRDKLGNIDLPCQLPFVDFDACFEPDFTDDTPPHIQAWLYDREGTYWSQKCRLLLALVKDCQHRLRHRDDYLLQREIRQIDDDSHPCDFLPAIERLPVLDFRYCADPTFTPLLRQKIGELIKQDDVRSVSCPYRDYDVWRMLVAEQLRRADTLGVPPREAFTLSGPDGGGALRGIPYEAWGGEVHIPYEGLCGGDLLIRPTWRKFRVPQGTATGRLSTAASVNGCYYVLSPEDFSEVPFAARSMVGDWVLYQSNTPYDPCDVFGVKEFEAIKKKAASSNESEG
jgi:hypothetical protein